MDRPVRLQRRRIRGFVLALTAPNQLQIVCVTRPSKYSNPHKIGFCKICGVSHTRADAVAQYAREITPEQRDAIRADLRGKNIACWCRLDHECHGDILLKMANEC